MAVAVASGQVAPESDRPGWGIVVGFLVIPGVLGLGRTTLLPGAEFASVRPSAGITVLWLLVRRARPLSLDTGLLSGAMPLLALLSAGRGAVFDLTLRSAD